MKVEMARKFTSCKTELRMSYSNSKRNISQQDKEKTIHSKLKNTFALVLSVLNRRYLSTEYLYLKDDQNAIKNIHITIWLINIITPYKLTEQTHPICKAFDINILQF